MLDAPGDAAPGGRAAAARAGRRRAAGRGARLRRLPHRPARRRRRAARPAAARSSPGTRSSAGAGRGRDRLRAGRPRRRALARLDRAASAASAAAAARTSATARASPATSCDGGYAEYAVADARFCFPIPGRLRRPPGGAAPVRRADRLPRAAARGRRRAARPLRLRRGAHIVAQVARHQGRRVFAFTRAGDDDGPGVRARARRRVGGCVASARRPRSSTRRSSSRRSARSCPRRCARCAKGGVGGLRRHPHERHPAFPYELLWGERVLRSVANLTRARRRGVPRARTAGAGARPRWSTFRSRRRTKRSLGPAGGDARRRRPPGGPVLR